MTETTWRPAHAISTLLAELNKKAPGRYKGSDGILGDPAHAARDSDHNPNAAGVVRAVDITNDPDDHDGNPANDMPGQTLANLLAGLLGRHPAMMSGAYVIFNRRIISYDRLAEGWRPYDGLNAHKTHVHLSVSTKPAGYDSRQAWNLWTAAPTPLIDHAIKDTLAAIAERPPGGPVRELLEQALPLLKAAQRAAR
jgi:hypothetical protein